MTVGSDNGDAAGHGDSEGDVAEHCRRCFVLPRHGAAVQRDDRRGGGETDAHRRGELEVQGLVLANGLKIFRMAHEGHVEFLEREQLESLAVEGPVHRWWKSSSR